MPIAITCANCGRPYPDTGAPHRCPVCHGVYDLAQTLPYAPLAAPPAGLGRMWRYAASFPLDPGAPPISLGEGGTPTVWVDLGGRQVACKLEYLNPTGSFKDRGSAVLLSFLRGRGVTAALEDSSGNAGASFAAYAARAGVAAGVYLPSYAAGPKRRQIEVHGAAIHAIPGPRTAAAEAVQAAAAAGAVYASHAYLPHGLAGYATVAFELLEDLGETPAAVIAPAGQGNLLLALAQGFAALHAAGQIARIPRLIGVQARACAPLWAFAEYGPTALGWVTEGETLAEGVRILHPVRGDLILRTILDGGGAFAAVDEAAILPARDALARRGLYVEPTSALVWSALEAVLPQLPDPVAIVLTGSGLKTPLG
jgi:threonine synthase